jgi:Family of unknown function (DUF6292)
LPDGDHGRVVVPVVRNEVGHRVDEVSRLLEETGLSYHRLHGPYIAAVADALVRAGVVVVDWYDNPDEPRDGAIELAETLGYEQLHIAWRETLGWYWIPSSDRHSALGDAAMDLPRPVDVLGLPWEVARSVCELLEHPPADLTPAWQPPDWYDAATEPMDDPWWDCNPMFERCLAAYQAYPAVT